MKVRRIQAKKTVEGYFGEGDIHVEYGDNPGVFYQEKFGPNENGIGLPIFSINQFEGGFEEYFTELESVEFSTTDRYHQVKDSLQHEVDSINMQISLLSERKAELENLLS